MVASLTYLLACLVVSIMGVRALAKMSRRTQHGRRLAFALLTAGAIVPLAVLIGQAAAIVTATDVGEALAAVSASAQISGTFLAAGVAFLLVVGARGQ
jgi:hypothetical protein